MKLTVDLGNYNTILTFGDEGLPSVDMLEGVARKVRDIPGVLFVPSLINFSEDRVSIGEEVLRRYLYGEESTFRDLKDHISHPSPVGRKVAGQYITHKEAAGHFLSRLLDRVGEETGEPLDVVLLYPNTERTAHRQWFGEVDLGRAHSVSLLDEDTALALGYDVNLYHEKLVMVFDFGFSSIRARVLHFNWSGRENYAPPVVRASAGLQTGSADLSTRILSELHADEKTHEKTPRFYWKRFVLHDDPYENLSDEKFKDILESENLGASVQKVIDKTIDELALSGYTKDDIKRVLLVGGGTRIPIVHHCLETNFGDLLRGDQPETAAGWGGLGFLTDAPVDDMVRDRYAMRVRDPITGQYHYPPVVEKYTRYPTKTPTARYVVNTFYDGQYELHLEIFRTATSGDDPAKREILFGDDGKMSFVQSGMADVHEPVSAEPLAIPISPPGRVGERRVLLEFGVDNQKRLVVSAKDLREEKSLWDKKPMINLK